MKTEEEIKEMSHKTKVEFSEAETDRQSGYWGGWNDALQWFLEVS